MLSAGVVALMAAVIGGGLKAFNIELPVLQSRGVRIALGGLGTVFLIAAFALRDDESGGSDRSAKRYQRQVVAACDAVRRNRSSFGTPKFNLADEPVFDRDMRVGRASCSAAIFPTRAPTSRVPRPSAAGDRMPWCTHGKRPPDRKELNTPAASPILYFGRAAARRLDAMVVKEESDG